MVTIEANSENKRIDVSKGSSVCSTASRTHAVYEMDQTVRVSYTPYPIKEADRFRLERLAKVLLKLRRQRSEMRVGSSLLPRRPQIHFKLRHKVINIVI